MTASQGRRSNVASLAGRRARAPRRRAQTLIADCREMLAEALGEALPGILDEIDDALFGLADRAGTDRLQSAYFETMRQIRLERDGLAGAFARALGERVQARVDRATGRPDFSLPPVGEVGLTLIENDELEESLAVGNMARKVRCVCREELFGLDRRVAALLGDPSIEDESNPLGPEVVCGALGEACKAFDAVTEVRVLVMKLLEQRVVRELETVYAELNAHLVRHGVLPDARAGATEPRRSAARRTPEPTAPSAPPPRSEPPTLAPAQQVPTFSAAGSGVPPGAARPGVPAEDGAGAEVVGLVQALVSRPVSPGGIPVASEPMPRERIMAGLTALQHGDAGAGGLAGEPFATAGADAGTRNVVRELRETGVLGAAARDDAVVIDVVAMIFDYVLGDEHVCAAVKAQIGRLQIPVLKVAIADHSFFARKGHPVRRYLDALSALGLGLDERDPAAERILEHVAESVAGILERFEHDPAPFAAALEALEAFLAREREEAEANAARAARAAEDAERLARARASAGEEIARRIDGKPVPELVRDFLGRRCRELLAQQLFVAGEPDDDFAATLEMIDELVWSVGPAPDDEHRAQVLDSLPFLVARLKSVHRDLGATDEEAERFLRELAELHLARVRGMAIRPATAPPAPASSSASYLPELMRDAIEGANRVVHAASNSDLARAGMGTTVVAVLARDTTLTVGHVGDSRLYQLRAGALTQLTVDHSMVQELVTKMGCSREEAAQLTGSNLLTRAIGPDATVVAELTRVETAAGDRYLLCSDGLSDLVDDAALASMLGADDTLEGISASLVGAANDAGGRDNVSVVLIEVRTPGEKLAMHGLSDVGRRRSHNEDSVLVDPEKGIAVLADGMGGHNAGEVASEMATSHVCRILASSADEAGGGDDAENDYASAFELGELEDFEVDGFDFDATPAISAHDEESARLLVDALELGAWVEFERDGYVTRARLVRVSEQTGRMLFLDRRGLKVADSTCEALIAEFREGGARALDESPLLERTMGDVAKHLRGALDAA